MSDGGIHCPRCHSRLTFVTRAVNLTNYKKRRYRQCRHCEKNFSSLEMLDDKHQKQLEDNLDDDDFYVVE